MTTAKPNILELAKQGHPRAIEALLNRQLEPKGITAKVTLKDSCLQISLESTREIDQDVLVQFIRKGLTALNLVSIEKVIVYGKRTEENSPKWNQSFLLTVDHKSDNFSQIPQSKTLNIDISQNVKSSILSESPVQNSIQRKENKRPQISHWYDMPVTIVTILSLLIFFPLGLFLMWRYTKWSPSAKWKVSGAFVILFIIALFRGEPSSQSVTSSPTRNASESSTPGSTSDSRDKQLLGTSPTGGSLWLGSDGCIYVRGLTEADLARLNTDVWAFKRVVKEQTGSRCVFFE